MGFIKKRYEKIKNRYGIVVPSLIAISTIVNLIASIWVSSFIYEPNIVNPFYVFAVLFFPFTSIIVELSFLLWGL